MAAEVELAHQRQQRLSAVTALARVRALRAWSSMDFRDLDRSWDDVGPEVAQRVTAGQYALAVGSDRYTAQTASAQHFAASKSAIVAEAFVGTDGAGRGISGSLFGAVTATKTAVAAGRGEAQSMLAGASYLGAMVKTLIADMGRSADMVSSAGRGYTHYVRVVGGGGCSRCAVLAGADSAAVAFKRHLNCECTAAPIVSLNKLANGFHASPRDYFDSLSDSEQDRIFTKAGAESIRSGADPVRVVNARRGANGVGYSSRGGGLASPGGPRGRLMKTTIGYRPNGDSVQVYTTSEATTARGSFGRQQKSTGRVRLMPESIVEIAGNDLKLRQAFLRDAGYLQYVPKNGWSNTAAALADIREQQAADRLLVNRATAKYQNFYLG